MHPTLLTRSLLIVVLGFATQLSPNATLAQEWTRFRGPNGAGQSEATTIPIAWGEGEYLWKAALPGQGNSSPVLWGDKLFLTSAEPDDGTRYVLCMSARDGELLWKRDFPSQPHRIHKFNTLASSTPAVDERRVYCAWSTPQQYTLLAMNHDGTSAWKVDLGPFVSQHGFATSPILYEDLVIITNDQDADSFLIALDRASGETRWKSTRERLPAKNAAYSTPCIYQPAGRPAELILCNKMRGVTSYNPLTGEENWQAGVLPARAVSSPIVAAGLVFATSGSGAGTNNVVALRPYANGDEPELVYEMQRTGCPYVPSLVAHSDLVFLWSDRGIATCIDAASGKIQWRERVGGNYFGSPVRVGNAVYCISEGGDVVALAASDEFKLLGRSPLGETSRATPAIADGRMFLRSASHVTAVGKR